MDDAPSIEARCTSIYGCGFFTFTYCLRGNARSSPGSRRAQQLEMYEIDVELKRQNRTQSLTAVRISRRGRHIARAGGYLFETSRAHSRIRALSCTRSSMAPAAAFLKAAQRALDNPNYLQNRLLQRPLAVSWVYVPYRSSSENQLSAIKSGKCSNGNKCWSSKCWSSSGVPFCTTAVGRQSAEGDLGYSKLCAYTCLSLPHKSVF
jgi:hypothetical protein